MRVSILGSGTSSGVPRIGNDWGACDPAEPRNRRTRASLLVEHGATRILVDTSPDLREQLLAADVATVDTVIWTHDHADHLHGIDDLRQLYHAAGRPIRGLARPGTAAVIGERFNYVVSGKHGYPAVVRLEHLPDAFQLGGIEVRVTDQPHGSITSAGLRFDIDGFAVGYATDFNVMTAEMASLYEGLDVWIVDALRRPPHPSHPTLDMVLAWAEQLRPSRTVLIHMDQSMDYATLRAQLPTGVEPGYDGFTVTA